MRKIKKDLKNHNSKNIDRTDLWLAPFERKKLIENGKPNFYPTFQKVELHNSTFFQ